MNPTLIAAGASGAMTGAGVWLAIVLVLDSRQARAHGAGTGPLPVGAGRARWTPSLIGAARTTVVLAHRFGLARLLLADDIALADRKIDEHTAARLARALTGAAAGVVAIVAAHTAGVPVSPLFGPLAALAGILGGLAWTDRPVRRLAAARRRETALAVATYIDLVRVLLVGGLPLHAALRAGADTGSGWAFAHIRGALDSARAAGLPPDEGLHRLAERYPVPALADLKRTITSARRGASPVVALEARALAIRSAEAARARADESVADAQMELPAAIIAIAFVAYLTYPLLTLIGTSVPT